ncbi:hypothetical protein [Baaleninema sp.]|uniref:hypothetical protein n=1 Tax=Baaleninema sp. TaxID=3101197 RepID=UPI003D090074
MVEECQAQFPGLITSIHDAISQHLTSTLQQENFRLDGFIEKLNRENSSRLGLQFNFPKASSVSASGLETQKHKSGSESLLKFHKVTISVRDIQQFQENMKRGLENYLEERLAAEDEADLEDAQEALETLIDRENSDFYRLQRLVDTESLGKLKKEAKICYLEYLQKQLEAEENPDVVYLKDLTRRLRAIESYINDSDKTDGDYEVSYRGETLNYKDWFSRAESLDALPIIPILSDSLGETTSEDGIERTFTFGVKLKFGNPVQARGGEPVFDYNLHILNPDNWDEQLQETEPDTLSRKILRRLLLYYFVFATDHNSNQLNPEADINFDVGQSFDDRILPVFQGNDEDLKTQTLREFVLEFTQDYNLKAKINKLKQILQEFVKRKGKLSEEYFHRKIGVSRAILENDEDALSQGHIFENVVGENPKKCLRYLTIRENFPSGNTFCQLSATFKFEDIRYYQTSDQERFDIEYAGIERISQVPILVTPDGKLSRKASSNSFRHKNIIVFSYNNRHLDRGRCNAVRGFIYRFTMSLLFYVTLRVILEELEKIQKPLFVPMLRFHEGDSENPSLSEEFMADLSKVTAHLLNDGHRSNSQGVRIKQRSSFKIQNALASLYSVLPQTFTFNNTSATQEPSLDKLGLIVVSSLESDRLRSNRDRTPGISTLFGESIGITETHGKIRIQLRKTFSQNYRDRDLFQHPSILSDIVHQFHQHGYRHILYIAQAPYTSNLNVTQVQDERQFYFMSPTLIRSMVGDLEDIHIYPMFFNKYYVRKLHSLKSSSYQLQDTSNLLNLVEDPSQQVVVFFNLFNGITVGKPEERFYNGVMSYSTLLNIYPGVLDDDDLRQGLIRDGSLKQDILRYLTLFHFFRLERTQRNPQLKLDPYERIIGEDSLHKNAIFKHMDGRTNFNNLAFLTEVTSILNPKPSSQEKQQAEDT